MSARGRLQWVEELVGGTEVEMASVDNFSSLAVKKKEGQREMWRQVEAFDSQMGKT